MPRHLSPGRLIVFEGIDGAGKTTQCRRLAERLRGEDWDVALLREPTDGPHGRRIREIAREGREDVSPREELDLFLRDREENVRENILPAIARGALVLLDRYYYSTIAYQGARGLDPALLRAENERFAPPADLLLYLSLPMDLVAERIEAGRGTPRDHFEQEDYLRRVKAIFDSLPDPQLVRIDAAAVAEAVWDGIWTTVSARLGTWQSAQKP